MLGRTKGYQRMPNRVDGASAKLMRNLHCNHLRNRLNPIDPKSGQNSSRPLMCEGLKRFPSQRNLLPFSMDMKVPMDMKAASMIRPRTVESRSGRICSFEKVDTSTAMIGPIGLKRNDRSKEPECSHRT